MSSEPSVVMVWHTGAVQKTEDLFTKELVVGGSGSGAENETGPRLLNAILGTKFKIISGYKSQTEALLAMERGEIAGIGSMSWPTLKTNKAAEYKDGRIKVLMQNGLKRDPELPNVPLSLELAKNDADKQALEFYFTQNTIARPIMAPPGVPPIVLPPCARRSSPWRRIRSSGRCREDRARPDPVSGEDVQRVIEKLADAAGHCKRVGDATNPNAK